MEIHGFVLPQAVDCELEALFHAFFPFIQHLGVVAAFEAGAAPVIGRSQRVGHVSLFAQVNLRPDAVSKHLGLAGTAKV